MVSKQEFYKELDRGKRYHPAKGLSKSKIAIVTPNTATEAVENLKDDEVVIIPYSRVPYGYREGPEATERFPMFLKRGPTIEIPTPKTLEEALREGTGPTTRRLEVYAHIHTMHSDAPAAGISWYCPQDRMHRKVSCNDVLEGMQIFAFSESEKRTTHPDKKHLVNVYEYGIDLENKDVGATAVVSVPSRGRDEPYRVKLHHFPFIGSHDVWVWMQLQTEHSDCGRKDFSDVYWQRDPETEKRRKLHDIVFCPHDVAAYLGVATEEKNRVVTTYHNPSRTIPLQPFPLFTQNTVSFWNKLWSQVFFGSPVSARPLREYEIELELQQFLAGYDPKTTMYTSSKLRNYSWDMSFPVKE